MKKSVVKKFYAVAIVCILPAILIYFNHAIFYQSFITALKKIFLNFLPFIFECLMFTGFSALLYAIINRALISVLCVQVFHLAITVISELKEAVTGTPLLLMDFEFINSLGEIAGYASQNLKISLFTIFIILLNVLVFVLLFVFVNKKTEREGVKSRLVWAACGLISVILFFSPLMSRLTYALSEKYVSEEEKIINYGIVNGLYFTYSSASATSYTPEREEINNLKRDTRVAIANYTFNPDPSVIPNVIIIMSEAFFDISTLPDVEFSSDPCPNFHALQEKGTSGKFYSPAYSGGTGFVETEFMTGISAATLKNGETLTSLSSTDVYKKLPVITDVFKNYGYETTFLHSHNNALYNRVEMYSGFDFDNIFFDDSFPENVTRYNTLISDSDLTQKIISLCETKSDAPMFLYAISMENHYPYFGGKYAYGERISVSSPKLNGEELTLLDCLADGINGADTALGELVDYIEKQDEPYMLVFFGDHLPNLTTSDGGLVYETLGLCESTDPLSWRGEEYFNMLQTDYVIWTNYEEEKDFPDKNEGSSFFGLNLLKRLGFNLTSFYIYLDTYVEEYTTFYKHGIYVGKDGKCLTEIPESQQKNINGYNTAARDIVYGDNEVFRINR